MNTIFSSSSPYSPAVRVMISKADGQDADVDVEGDDDKQEEVSEHHLLQLVPIIS